MNQISKLYFDTTNPIIDENSFPIISQILTDSWFQMPTLFTAQKLAEKAKSNIYLYFYGYHGSVTFCEIMDLKPSNFMLKVCAMHKYFIV